jgi:hypothetical protein
MNADVRPIHYTADTPYYTVSTHRKGEGGEKEGDDGSGGIKNNGPGLTYQMVTKLTLKAPVTFLAMFSLAASEAK